MFPLMFRLSQIHGSLIGTMFGPIVGCFRFVAYGEEKRKAKNKGEMGNRCC